MDTFHKTYPCMERDCMIEVGAPRRGRPSYRWVQGWVVHYAPGRRSIPLRYNDARNELHRVKK
jgi:hypothetical protein